MPGPQFTKRQLLAGMEQMTSLQLLNEQATVPSLAQTKAEQSPGNSKTGK